ncbi:MAG: ABC transporter ATP-binding protein [Rhodospirillales bacterium]
MKIQPVRSPESPYRSAPGIVLSGAGVVLDDGTRLFDGLSLEIAAGKTTCLLGPSGIGKSMLLRLVLGLLKPRTGGVADLFGTVALSNGEPVAGHAAYMAQQDLLLPWLRVADNVTIGPRLRGESVELASDRAARILDAVGLGRVGDRFPAALSGGMRQRAALARTIAEDRPLILMDEPFSQVDAITRLRLQTLAADLFVERTVLLVTHDPLEALRLGHRVVVMGGRPATVRSVHDLDDAPPRDPTGDGLLRRHAELLRALEEGNRWQEDRR